MHDRRPGTIKAYRNVLRNVRPHFGHHALKEISPIAVEKYQAQRLAEGRSPWTTNQEVQVLFQRVTWGYQIDYLQKKPIRRFRYWRESRDGRDRVVSHEEESRLLFACRPKLRPLVVTALQTGLRRNELLTLTWDAIDLEERTSTIKAEQSKNRNACR